MGSIWNSGDTLENLNKDVFAALTADWWHRQMVANVATVSRGFSGAQYVRQMDGSWAIPGTSIPN